MDYPVDSVFFRRAAQTLRLMVGVGDYDHMLNMFVGTILSRNP